MIRVAVLRGGVSAERAVSLATGAQIVAALDRSRYDVSEMDVSDLPNLGVTPEAERPDVVFIALHGPGGEDGSVQGFLEVLGVRYTGSGILASALAMDKIRCKTFLDAHGVKVPRGLNYHKHELPAIRDMAGDLVGRQIGYPVVVKPSRQGSTYGARIVRGAGELVDALEFAFRYDTEALVEERLFGMEITVSVLGNRAGELTALPVVEIVPAGGFFDYDSKYSESGAEEIVPARLDEPLVKLAQRVALRCHALLGCAGMSRTDMFVTDKGVVTLETNTIPGMTPTSLLPKAAKAAGMAFGEVLDEIIGHAMAER